MQKRVYFYRAEDHAVLALPVMPIRLYQPTYAAGYRRCTLKQYKLVQAMHRFAVKQAKKVA